MGDQRFCIQCGNAMEADALFCPLCGSRQDGASMPPPKAPIPPPAPYQQPAYQRPVYQQPYPPQYSPQQAPQKRGGGGGFIFFIFFLIVLAGAFYGVARFTQLLPESIQEALPEWLQSESFDPDEGEYIVEDEDEEDEDTTDKDTSKSTDKDKDAGTETKSGGLFNKGTNPTTQKGQDSGVNTKLTKDDLFGKWDGELTFTEIVLSKDDQANMSEEDKALMKSMLNNPMPLVFQFYKDEAGVYTTIGVINSPDMGESDMDAMVYEINNGRLIMTYSDSSSEVLFEGAISESNGTYAMDGTFSINAVDGGGQVINGIWNISQTSTEVTIP